MRGEGAVLQRNRSYTEVTYDEAERTGEWAIITLPVEATQLEG